VIDGLRRDGRGRVLFGELAALTRGNGEATALEETAPLDDDQLRLIFTCCHPALSEEAQIALTLRLLGGLSTAEVARAFLVPEPTMAQRVVRAKRKIRAARIPYRIPEGDELPERLPPVLAVLYLIYNAGQARTTEPDLCREAIHLTRVLVALMPDEPEVGGLLALLLFTESRRRARVRPDGSLAVLGEQDRRDWDWSLITEGQQLLDASIRRGLLGLYQLQAAINAVHARAPSIEHTDWSQIVMLYDQLLAVSPTPVIALNRAVAVAEVEGPLAALEIVDEQAHALDGYHPFHATRADLLRRLGRAKEASAAYERAAALTTNQIERDFFRSGGRASR
jgi:RNA polymerase sigma-70 factor (ECF subfamily)